MCAQYVETFMPMDLMFNPNSNMKIKWEKSYSLIFYLERKS